MEILLNYFIALLLPTIPGLLILLISGNAAVIILGEIAFIVIALLAGLSFDNGAYFYSGIGCAVLAILIVWMWHAAANPDRGARGI